MPTEFKIRIERTDSDEGCIVTITTLPLPGQLEPVKPQEFYSEGLDWIRDLVHDWMVDNIQ